MKKDLGRNIDLFKPRHKKRKRPKHFYTTFDFSVGMKVFGAMTKTCLLYDINLQTGQKYRKFIDDDKKEFYDKYVKYLGKDFEVFAIKIFKISLPKYIGYKTNREYHLRKAFKENAPKRRVIKVRRAGLLYALQYRAYVFYILKLSKIFVDANVTVSIEKKRIIWSIINIIKEFCNDFFNEVESSINYHQYEVCFNRAISAIEKNVTANALSMELVEKITALKTLALHRDKFFEKGIELLNIPENQITVRKTHSIDFEDDGSSKIGNQSRILTAPEHDLKSVRVNNKEKNPTAVVVQKIEQIKPEPITKNDIVSQTNEKAEQQRKTEEEKYEKLAQIERIQRETTLRSTMLAFNVVKQVKKEIDQRIADEKGLLDFSGKVPIIKQVESTFKLIKDLSDAINKTPQVAIQINNTQGGGTEMKIQESTVGASDLFKTGMALSKMEEGDEIIDMDEEVQKTISKTSSTLEDFKMYEG